MWVSGECLVTTSDEHARPLGRATRRYCEATLDAKKKARGSPLGTLHCYTLPGVGPCRELEYGLACLRAEDIPGLMG